MVGKRETCRAVKVDGTPCRGFQELSDEGLCPAHDPARAALVFTRRSKGRRNAVRNRRPVHKPNSIETLETCTIAKAWAWQEYTGGRIDKDEVLTYLKIIESQEKTLSGSLGDDLKAMKALLEGLKKEMKK